MGQQAMPRFALPADEEEQEESSEEEDEEQQEDAEQDDEEPDEEPAAAENGLEQSSPAVPASAKKRKLSIKLKGAGNKELGCHVRARLAGAVCTSAC